MMMQQPHLPLLLVVSIIIWQQSSYISQGGAFAFLSPTTTSSLSISRISKRRSSHQDPANQHFKPSSSSSPPLLHQLYSTPFDLDLYNSDDDNDDDQSNNNDDPSENDEDLRPPLAAHPSTKLILGINKYSHDTTLCAADILTSQVLFAMSKEYCHLGRNMFGHIRFRFGECRQGGNE
jgi:hypothetical protein